MKTVITNGKLICGDEILVGRNLVLNGSVITEITGSTVSEADKVIDAGAKYVSPGFIDMHTHGAGGHDFMDGTEGALKGACLTHLAHGTTSICPTTLTALPEELNEFFAVYRKVKREWAEGPELLGVHLEGPFFSPLQAGAQNPKYLKNPVPEEYLPVLEAGGEDISRMSVAPELEGGFELGRELKKRGIIAAIGHSDASYIDVVNARECGYSHITHFYSCMSTLHRVGPYRVMGIVESAYLFDDLTVEIIADGKHLPPELLKMIVKCKGVDKISLVTDSMRGAGMPEGEHVLLGSLTHGQEAIIRDGVAMMPDFKAFAGSVCTADRCVYTMHHLAETSLTDAVKMMTANPAKILGVSARKGSLECGKDADLVIFDDDINVEKVFVRGMLRYARS